MMYKNRRFHEFLKCDGRWWMSYSLSIAYKIVHFVWYFDLDFHNVNSFWSIAAFKGMFLVWIFYFWLAKSHIFTYLQTPPLSLDCQHKCISSSLSMNVGKYLFKTSFKIYFLSFPRFHILCAGLTLPYARHYKYFLRTTYYPVGTKFL
jgi:hypothetical protein